MVNLLAVELLGNPSLDRLPTGLHPLDPVLQALWVLLVLPLLLLLVVSLAIGHEWHG